MGVCVCVCACASAYVCVFDCGECRDMQEAKVVFKLTRLSLKVGRFIGGGILNTVGLKTLCRIKILQCASVHVSKRQHT